MVRLYKCCNNVVKTYSFDQLVGENGASWNTGYVETWLITLCQQYFCIVGFHLVNSFAPSFPAILSENFDLQNWKHQQGLFIFYESE